MRWIGIAARLVVGGLWFVAGLIKIRHPAENVRAVRAYDLLPGSVAELVGNTLPVFEIVVGFCLIVGLFTRWMAVASVAMLVAFIVGIVAAWARGMSIECGCFGTGGGPSPGASDTYPWVVARDIGLLAAAAWLVRRPRTPYSLDELLRARRTAPQEGLHQ